MQLTLFTVKGISKKSWWMNFAGKGNDICHIIEFIPKGRIRNS
jgi:hypothetical protein